MSEAFALTDDWPVYSPMAGRLDPHATICAACSHIHQRIEGYGNDIKTWISGCWCGCVASGSDYLGTNVPIDTYQPRSVADVVSAISADDDDNDNSPKCAHGLDAATCVQLGHGDAGGESGLESRRYLRGGGLYRFFWSGLSRLAGNQRDELGRERRVESAAGCGPRDAGLANHGGGAHPAGPTGSGRLRCLVIGRRRLA